MNSKQFIKKADAIIKNYDCKKLTGKYTLLNSYEIETIFGTVYFRIDPSPKIKVYSLFMQFKECDKFNLDLFKSKISKYDLPSTYSLKWNLHNDAEYILEKLYDRLEDFKHLTGKVN